MKTTIIYFLVAAFILFQNNLSSAQGGTDCSSAVDLYTSNICNYTTYNSTGGEMWFKFTATSENVHISLVTVEYGVDLPHIHNIRVFEGTCVNNTIREDKDLPFSDSINEINLDMISYGLIVGNVYYIKASRIPHEGECERDNCTDNSSTDPATFDICIKDLNIVIPPNSTEAPSSHIAYLQNNGQVYDINGNSASEVLYYSTYSNPATYVLSDRAAFVWENTDSISTTSDSIQRIDMTFPNNLGPSVYSSQQTEGLTHFYNEYFPMGLISNRSFDRIIYNDLYKNIDLHYYSSEDGLKFYYIIKPGGDPTDIKMKMNGADSTFVTSTSGLAINSFKGDLKFKKCIVQSVDLTGNIGVIPSSGSFYSSGTDEYQIVVGTYNPTHFVVITLEQEVVKKPNGSNDIEWSTYFGGNNNTTAEAIDVNSSGIFYVAGTLTSTNFPATFGTHDQTLNGFFDGYLSQFNNNYSKIWLTYFGGDGYDRPFSINHDGFNNVVYVSGATNSSSGTFVGQVLSANPSSYVDGNIAQKSNFIQRFNNSGIREWSTFFAGSGTQGGWERSVIKTDETGNVYCTANVQFDASSNLYGTYSTTPLSNGDHPICGPTANSYQQFGNDLSGVSRDIVLMNFDNNLNLVWSTFVGGTGNIEAVNDIAIDNTNNFIYLVGVTNSSAGTPCSSNGAGGFPICDQNFYFQNQISGDRDGFITRFNLDGTLNYSTFFGGAGRDKITGITLKFPGDFYITGSTSSNVYSTVTCSSTTNGLFPNCPNGGYTQAHGGGIDDAFVAGFRNTTNLTWSTFFGGTGNEGDALGNSMDSKITFNDDEDLFVYGGTSQSNGFPIQSSTVLNDGYFFENNYAGGTETYVARFSPSRLLLWCTYYGGDNSDYLGDIAPFEDRLYICGNTKSQNVLPYNCPPTIFPYCQSQSGTTNTNGYIANLRYDPQFLGNDENDKNLNSEIDGFELFPNPTTGELKIKLNHSRTDIVNIEVLDQLGKVLFIEFMDSNLDQSYLSFDFSVLTPGLYYININGKNYSAMKKFLKL